ncbi:MAG: WD40 repeat domain-containing protein [Planctomycetes bacterium]|nr:WD40 repeat domain-containing protein [Planctomycetota bacterium]
MRVLKTAPKEVLDVAFSPDCRAIAAAVEGAGVFLWNLDSPNIAPVRLEAEGGYRAGGLNFSACGRRLAWLSFNGRRTYDRDDRTAIAAVYPMPAAHGMFHGSDDAGTRAVSNHSFPDHCLIGWKWVEGEWVRQWQLSTRELSVESVTLAPVGDRFAMFTRVTVGGRWWEQPMRLEVRDVADAAVRTTGTYPYSYAAKPLRFHPAGEQIAGVNNMTLLVWSLPAGGDPRLVQNDNRKHFTALAYHPDGRSLFVTSNDETVQVFDARSLDRANRYTWQLDKLSAVAVSPDGTLAAAGSANGDVVVWDLE